MEEFDRELMKQKLDPLLLDIVTQTGATLPLIVQTVDGLKDEDRAKVNQLGGKIKDDLYIINAFSAEMSTDAVLEMIKSERVVRIYYDAEVRAM
ncbi:MAG: hypothetical protein LWY06_15475 [Firmicutes bacterium]|nr:hypothetical protein [Bacillota bacterium]